MRLYLFLAFTFILALYSAGNSLLLVHSTALMSHRMEKLEMIVNAEALDQDAGEHFALRSLLPQEEMPSCVRDTEKQCSPARSERLNFRQELALTHKHKRE